MNPRDALSLLWSEIHRAAEPRNLDTYLLAAIVFQESAGRPFVTRYEPAFRWLDKPEKYARALGVTTETETVHQKTSWGLCQVMGATARSEGFLGHLPELCAVPVNLDYGARVLAGKIWETGNDIPAAIAAYNAGAPRLAPDGSFKNQKYVDSVLEHWAELKA